MLIDRGIRIPERVFDRREWMGGVARFSLCGLLAASLAETAEPQPSLPKTKMLYLGGNRFVDFVLVQAGEFMMGSTGKQIDLAKAYLRTGVVENEGPIHRVKIPYSFYIGKFEVTNWLYDMFLKESGKEPRQAPKEILNYGCLPVVNVSREEARDFCEWFGEDMVKQNRRGFEGFQARLPTEYEWEYAARGPESRIFPWGNDDREFNANYRVVYRRTPDGESIHVRNPEVVGSKTPGMSWCGAMDMAGNVAEWVANDFYEYPTRSEQVSPNRKYGKGDIAVARGGSFFSDLYATRCASRWVLELSSIGKSNLGFRLVLIPNG